MEKIDVSFINEINYRSEMIKKVEPYLASIVQSGTFTGYNKVKISYATFLVEQPKGTIVLSHGFCESIEKYYEFIYYLTKQGYDVFAIDHRSHGNSQRLGKDGQQVHVENFQDYVNDFKGFMDKIVMPTKKTANCLLFAHSMGGAIGALFLEQYPKYFQGAVLNAPMMEIHTGAYPSWLASGIAYGMIAIGKQKEYIFGQGPFKNEINVEQSGTSSEARYLYYHQKRIEKDCLQTDGGSFNWFNQGIKATKKLIRNASKVTIPVLLFQAEKDTFVKPNGHHLFAKKSKRTRLYVASGAKHEIYFERDEIMRPYVQQVLSFYEEVLKELENVVK